MRVLSRGERQADHRACALSIACKHKSHMYIHVEKDTLSLKSIARSHNATCNKKKYSKLSLGTRESKHFVFFCLFCLSEGASPINYKAVPCAQALTERHLESMGAWSAQHTSSKRSDTVAHGSMRRMQSWGR
jgi:hypothetical protein